jgi:hypothetical protein
MAPQPAPDPEPEDGFFRRMWHWMSVPNPEPLPITCKVCDRGELRKKDIFRMSGPVVVIGFILLIPSILGMVVSAVTVAGMLSASTWKDTSQAGVAGLGIVFLTGLVVFVASFVGGLLGWLLIMQKRVLQCSECRAIVNAS